MTTAGFIGLGNIGRPMALRLAARAGGLWVYDLDRSATDALAAAGAKVAASVAEVAANCGVISVMVRDDEQVRAVFGELLPAARRGCVVAVHSTIHPHTAHALGELAAPYRVGVLDAPVSGGAMGAQDGSLAIMVGGPDGAFAAAEEVLTRMGELVVHLGPLGAGTAAKLARNLLHFVAFTAAGEAARLAEAAGVDLRTLGRIVRHTDAVTGGPGAIMHRDTTAAIPPGDGWEPIFAHVRSLGEKDLTFALDLAGELGVDVPLARIALDRLGPSLGLPERSRT
jgi:3-hydroxyisobutyrate dehydrogenase